MNKDVVFGKDSQTKILEGIDITSNAVGGTIGPKGRNVYIDHPQQPKWTNDGATIATNVVLKDPIKNIGAKLVKNACGQTNDDAGDGTTTATVLAQSIISEGLKMVAAGANRIGASSGVKIMQEFAERAPGTKPDPVAAAAGSRGDAY